MILLHRRHDTPLVSGERASGGERTGQPRRRNVTFANFWVSHRGNAGKFARNCWEVSLMKQSLGPDGVSWILLKEDRPHRSAGRAFYSTSQG